MKNGWKIGFVLVLLLLTFTLGRLGRARFEPEPLLGLAASATSLSDGSSLATGYFNNGVEAIYYLDSQNGRLSAGVISRNEPSFTKLYTRVIRPDLENAVEQLKIPLPADPRFIMETGEVDTRQIGAGEMNNFSKAFLYVAEVQTGIVLVYALPVEGDRDLEVRNGEIIFWTYARMNPGNGH